MFENVYAHTRTNEPDKEHWQTLEAHLEGTAKKAAEFASKFGSSAWGYAAGMLHDLGKAHKLFQEYLENANENPDEKTRCAINHSTAGAIYAERNLGPFVGRTLAYVVAGHHAGLPDYYGGQASLSYRTQDDDKNQKDLEPLEDAFDSLKTEIQRNTLTPPKTFKMSANNYNFWVRFLFSCLIDADRLDTENFDDPQKTAQRGNFKSIPELKNAFDDYMERFNQTPPKDESEDVKRLRIARNDVLRACRQSGQADQEKDKIYTLSVPTGGGKTLSSMAFALENAVKFDKKRIIYVVPFTTIIEQTGEKFAEIFGRENVVEHHSNFDASKRTKEDANEEEDVEYLRKIELATENWDAPIIVTTNVQFFESLFAAKTSRCRKLHNIVDSVVILDEAQALPTNFIAPCVEALNVLSESFGVTPVLCTATQPAFEHIDKVNSISKYTPLNEAEPIISPELESRLFADLARVRYEFDPFDQRRSWEELAEELASSENEEVLCIVNTRRDCYELYQELKKQVEGQENARTICLSALMCGEHRSKIIQEIRETLEQNRTQKKKTPLRVVATQLVEAGVDIDFPVVYRALAGLDSIVQAGGRCNREGKLGREGGKVVVFSPKNDKSGKIPSINRGISATKDIIDCNKFIITTSEISRYFKQLYAFTDLDTRLIRKEYETGETEYICQAIREKNIDFLLKLSPQKQQLLGKNLLIKIPFRTVGDSFKLIDNDYTVPVITSYENGKELIKRLQNSKSTFDSPTFRELQRYTVNIPENMVSNLVKMNKIIPISLAKGLSTDYYVQYSTYDEEVGFDIFDETLEFLDS